MSVKSELADKLSGYMFASPVNYVGEIHVFDLTQGYDTSKISEREWGIGRYDEYRPEMYVAPQYGNRRNIHMGIDIWAPAGEPVAAFYEGTVAYIADNDEPGNYGPTVVTKHRFDDTVLYALHGHLSRDSLEELSTGQTVARGETFSELGTESENGGWLPHLHFQLSTEDPGTADMPGVVAEEERKDALSRYPDPRIILGPVY